MTHSVRIISFALCALILLPLYARAQTPNEKATAQPAKTSDKKTAAREAESADPSLAERRATIVTLAQSLADEAQSYKDEKLRARVLARVADALWDTETARARALFFKAWAAAEMADKEDFWRVQEERRKSFASQRGAFIVRSASNLRSEVLRLAARHDRALSEEFLSKIEEFKKQEGSDSASATANTATAPNQAEQQAPFDRTNPPPALAQRLELARRLLDDNQIERAMQIADPGLERITVRGMNFLSSLREKNPAAADQRFAALLQRAAADMTTDAATVSILSSYAFTPFLTILYTRGGSSTTSSSGELTPPPDLSPQLHAAFFAAAAQILLRPLPPADQDKSFAGRAGTYFVIARLLPLFDQYAPKLAPALRAQLASLTADAPERFRNGNDNMLKRGLSPEDAKDEIQEAIERAERAAKPEERDFAWGDAARAAERKDDPRAREFADKIEDTDLRHRVRAFVDFGLLRQAIEKKKDPQEILRLSKTGELTNIQKSWAYMSLAKQLRKTDPGRAAELLDQAAAEARRISESDPDHVRALVALATEMYEQNPPRVWELMSEVIKAANSAPDFTGEDGQLAVTLRVNRSVSSSSNGVNEFDLSGIFRSLTKLDLYHTIELAKSFQAEAPRAASTLAIIRTVLDEKPKAAK